MNNKDADQSAQMRRLVCTFVVRKPWRLVEPYFMSWNRVCFLCIQDAPKTTKNSYTYPWNMELET